jgi:hypothetical protein
MYAKTGRPSIPPEHLLRALLLQVLYSVRSERMLIEQLEYNLLFRWFVGLDMDEAVWVPTTFTKNRDRLLEGDIARAFFAAVRDERNQRQRTCDSMRELESGFVSALYRMPSEPGRTPSFTGDCRRTFLLSASTSTTRQRPERRPTRPRRMQRPRGSLAAELALLPRLETLPSGREASGEPSAECRLER